MDSSVDKFVKSLVKEFREEGYSKALGVLEKPLCLERTGSNGEDYQINIGAFYDDKQERHIRVTFEIFNDAHKKFWQRLLGPIDTPIQSEDYIIAPDGSFVGE